jgi:hypothetical protein
VEGDIKEGRDTGGEEGNIINIIKKKFILIKH